MPNYILIAANEMPEEGPFSVGYGYEAHGSNYKTSWDDLKFPATAINPPGQASDPDVEAASGLLLFDAGTTELIYALAQMPHSWKEGSEISPHIHWTKTASEDGDVVWRVRYKHYPIAGVGDADWSTCTAEGVVSGTPDNDTANEHLISGFNNMDMTGYTLSHCILFEVARIGGDAADTASSDVRLLEFDIHYQVDSFGSELEFIK